MAFAEDFAPFFTDFGTEALFDGASEPVRVIFDGAAERSMLGELGMATTSPAIHLPTTEVPSAVEGKGVTVGSSHYEVAEHQPDGTGMSILFLTRA